MVQAALDRVSKDRTTITIAHRLATVKKADNIIVMRKGKCVQQGTHEELLAEEGGAYWTLATAQQLTIATEEGDDDTPVASEISGKPSVDDFTTNDEHGAGSTTTTAPHENAKTNRGFLGSFGLLLREQRHHWGWYLVLLVGAVGGGGTSLPISE